MKGELDSRLPITNEDRDIDKVARAVNLMLDEIARLLEQSEGQVRLRHGPAQAHSHRPRRRRSAHPTSLRLSADQCGRRQDVGRRGRADATRCRQQPIGHAVGQQPSEAEFLAEHSRTAYPIPIVAQMPQYRIDTMSDLINMPITSSNSATTQYLGGLAHFTPGPSPGVVSHYNVQPVIDIYGAVQERDLGSVSNDIERILKETRKDRPRGSHVVLAGQVDTMTSAYIQLYFGLAGAIVLIYLVIVVNFQSLARPVHHHHGAAWQRLPASSGCCS